MNLEKKYLNELIKTIFFSNLYLIILNIILVLIGLNVFNNNKIITTVKNYQMANWIYLIFSIIKFFVLVELVSIFNVILFKLINNKIIVVVNIILYILIAGIPLSDNVVMSITQIPLFIGSYLIYQLYSSFLFEVLCFCLYFGFLCIIFYILKYFVIKYMKDVAI